MGKATTIKESKWEEDAGDNYLIYADSKFGKTFLAAVGIKEHLDTDETSQCYVINTDKGFTEPALEVGLDRFGSRIHYYFVNNIQEGIDAIRTVRKIANKNDIVLFDLLSWVWDESQKSFIAELGGEDVVGLISKAMRDPKKFGTFESMQWGYIKKLDDMISNYLSKNPVCKTIALARVKDVTVEYVKGKKDHDVWFELGRPDGRKDIMFEFANIIKIRKKEAGKRQFIVVGTRRGDQDYKWRPYTTGEDFWNKLGELIGNKRMPTASTKKDPVKKKPEPKPEPTPEPEPEEETVVIKQEEPEVDTSEFTKKAVPKDMLPSRAEEGAKKLSDVGAKNVDLVIKEDGTGRFSEEGKNNQQLLGLLAEKQKLQDANNPKKELKNIYDRANFIIGIAKTIGEKATTDSKIFMKAVISNCEMSKDQYHDAVEMLGNLGKVFEPSINEIGFINLDHIDKDEIDVIGEEPEDDKPVAQEEAVKEEPVKEEPVAEKETTNDGAVEW